MLVTIVKNFLCGFGIVMCILAITTFVNELAPFVIKSICGGKAEMNLTTFAIFISIGLILIKFYW